MKHGSPDMSCVVMTTCKEKPKVNRVLQKSWIGLNHKVKTKQCMTITAWIRNQLSILLQEAAGTFKHFKLTPIMQWSDIKSLEVYPQLLRVQYNFLDSCST